MTIQIPEKPRSVTIQIFEPEESRNGEEAMISQCLVSVDGDPKNYSYINNGASIHNLFNKELFAGLVKLDRALKIQTGGKPIPLSQTRSLHQSLQHLLFPMSTYHYSENAISNMSPVVRLVNEYYTIYNTRYDNTIYVWSKKYGKHIQFPRDHKFNLYYMGISEADMDKYC